MERLDLQHQLWLLTLHNELFLAPIPAPRNVLDIGTGTGIWAIELATRHPAAAVLGTDLSPMQPPYVPPNCAFEVDDAEDEWDYAARFDLIHGRALATCFRNPRGVIGSAFGQLAPGGYLEFHDLVLPMLDIDGTLAGTAVGDWQARTMAAAATLGMRWKETQNYARYFEEAGFVDVVEQHFQWPLNRWAKGDHLKMLGTYWQEDLNRGLEGLSMAALTRGGGMSREEVLVLTAEARKDIKKKSIHAYLPV
jgi:SAM-dependent methyltransferase